MTPVGTTRMPVRGAEPDREPVRRLWGGRFAGGPSVELDRLNRSLPVDRRLWREDIAGSRAWLVALRDARVIAPDEEARLAVALHHVGATLDRWTEADWAAAPDEDIHSLVERLLHEEEPDLAGKLHTGRSRNDQVATDTRLWAMEACRTLDGAIAEVQEALLLQAEANLDVVMPGYTHLQRAQPVSAAHWLLSHFWPLDRDRQRIADATARVAVLPLGSGALAGCPFPVDRVLLKEVLGFRTVTPNSMDAVADRDWVAELLFAIALAGTHLSRLGEDLVLFGSAEFGFVRFDDAFCTGSSLMPHKRNPDAMELARGKAGRLLGELTGFLATLKGLPSGYNKDLQDDKDALFRAVDTLLAVLPAVAGTVRTLSLDADRCAAAVDAAMLTTDLADALVRAGVPFRLAHERVGRLVRRAEELGRPVSQLPSEALGLGPDAPELSMDEIFDAHRSLARRNLPGGTARSAVSDQIARARTCLVYPGAADL